MAYASKYELVCKSKVFDRTYTAKIKKADYLGSVIDRNIPGQPFRMVKDSSSPVIKGTSFEFGMREEVDWEFMELFTTAPRGFAVDLYWDSTCIWKGFINTQQYSAPYKPVRNNIWFMASDGLGLLKDQLMTITGWQTELAVINNCLYYIQSVQQMELAIAIWIHEVNHDTGLSPLDQTYINCDILEGLSCYEIIEKILARYDAEITQIGGRWVIECSRDKLAGYYIYDWEGNYQSVIQPNDVMYLDYPDDSGELWPVDQVLQHGLEPGGRQVRIVHNYGLRDSMLRNYGFSKWAWIDEDDHTLGVDFEDWSEVDPFSQYVTYEKHDNDGNSWAFLDGNSNATGQARLSQVISITNIADHIFVFEVDSAPVGLTLSSANVQIQVTLVTGGTTYYLSTTGWTTTPTTITVAQEVTPYPGSANIYWQNIKILTDEIPGSGVLTVGLLASDAGSSMRGVVFRNPKVYFTDDGALFPDKLDVTATFPDSSEMMALDDAEVIAADAPDLANSLMMYDNITLYYLSATFYNSLITSAWKFYGFTHEYTLIEILLKLLASRNWLPRQTLTGVIKGNDHMNWGTLFEHTYNDSRRFEIQKGEWNMRDEKWNVTLLEVPEFTDKEITLSDGTTIESEADLNVASGIILSSTGLSVSEEFTAEVHIDNDGDTPGGGVLEWQIASDSYFVPELNGSQVIRYLENGHDVDITLNLTAPSTPQDYVVMCRIAGDESWQISDMIQVT